MPDSAESIRNELIELFGDPAAALDDDAFNTLALRAFARTSSAVPAYAHYCRARGRAPGTVDRWTAIPAVPTAAFRELSLIADGMSAERVFRTSGTSRGPERRGRHPVADLDVYRAALRPTFRRFLLPDDARPRFLSLMPPAAELPDSSLAFMIDDVIATFGAEGSRSYARADGIDFDGLEAAIEGARRDGVPTLLLGTSAAFIHWLDRLGEQDRVLELPQGSRLMDTGGFKGRGRAVEPATLRALYGRRLELPARACVNEYGMTELLSQRYDTALRDQVEGTSEGRGERPGGRAKAGPPWLRTVAVDPETLEPRAAGEPGILRHVDLANIDSVIAIQTEDIGRVEADGGVVLQGRSVGAPPRGCSIAMDMLLEGVR